MKQITNTPMFMRNRVFSSIVKVMFEGHSEHIKQYVHTLELLL